MIDDNNQNKKQRDLNISSDSGSGSCSCSDYLSEPERYENEQLGTSFMRFDIEGVKPKISKIKNEDFKIRKIQNEEIKSEESKEIMEKNELENEGKKSTKIKKKISYGNIKEKNNQKSPERRNKNVNLKGQYKSENNYCIKKEIHEKNKVNSQDSATSASTKLKEDIENKVNKNVVNEEKEEKKLILFPNGESPKPTKKENEKNNIYENLDNPIFKKNYENLNNKLESSNIIRKENIYSLIVQDCSSKDNEKYKKISSYDSSPNNSIKYQNNNFSSGEGINLRDEEDIYDSSKEPNENGAESEIHNNSVNKNEKNSDILSDFQYQDNIFNENIKTNKLLNSDNDSNKKQKIQNNNGKDYIIIYKDNDKTIKRKVIKETKTKIFPKNQALKQKIITRTKFKPIEKIIDFENGAKNINREETILLTTIINEVIEERKYMKNGNNLEGVLVKQYITKDYTKEISILPYN